jgi:hypothetical protein
MMVTVNHVLGCKVYLTACFCLFMAWLLFDPEDGSNMFLRKGGSASELHGVTTQYQIFSVALHNKMMNRKHILKGI